MKRCSVLMLCAFTMFGCAQNASPPDAAQLAKERDAVHEFVAEYLKSSYTMQEAKTIDRFMSSSGDLLCFGTDSAEVLRTAEQRAAQARLDRKIIRDVRMGEVKNLSVLMANDGIFATAVMEFPLFIATTTGDTHAWARLALVLRKEAGQWRIVQSMLSFATRGESSAEVLQRSGL